MLPQITNIFEHVSIYPAGVNVSVKVNVQADIPSVSFASERLAALRLFAVQLVEVGWAAARPRRAAELLGLWEKLKMIFCLIFV